MSARPQSELALVAAVVSGDSGAAARLLEIAGPTLWAVVQKLEGAGPDGQAAFLEIVAAFKADGYARLKAFDGRARLSTYLALVARELLSERLARRLIEAPRDAWVAFERLFAADIRRRIAQRFPREAAARDDAYQDVCLKLVEDDFRRIRAYDGRGSFLGYALTVVERILIDRMRRDAPRRRLPAAVARLAALDREIYIAVVWKGCPADGRRLAAALQGRFDRDPDAAEIHDAIERIAAVARLEPAAASGAGQIVPLDALTGTDGLSIADRSPDPEQHLLLAEEAKSRADLLDAVKLAADGLPADERCYLQTIFSATEPLPPRETARILGCPVEEIYRLRQRACRRLKEILDRLEKSRARPSEFGNGDLDHGTRSTRAN
jgi:RNA polymerase primary sigma factor